MQETCRGLAATQGDCHAVPAAERAICAANELLSLRDTPVALCAGGDDAVLEVLANLVEAVSDMVRSEAALEQAVADQTRELAESQDLLAQMAGTMLANEQAIQDVQARFAHALDAPAESLAAVLTALAQAGAGEACPSLDEAVDSELTADHDSVCNS